MSLPLAYPLSLKPFNFFLLLPLYSLLLFLLSIFSSCLSLSLHFSLMFLPTYLLHLFVLLSLSFYPSSSPCSYINPSFTTFTTSFLPPSFPFFPHPSSNTLSSLVFLPIRSLLSIFILVFPLSLLLLLHTYLPLLPYPDILSFPILFPFFVSPFLCITSTLVPCTLKSRLCFGCPK